MRRGAAGGPAPSPRVAYVVSHTHWDREWYQTLGEFRVDMDRVVRAALSDLEEGRLDHFVLDGQAILVEDYLAARPADRDRIRALVESGRLAVGPWYVLPDEFLVSGEATVRNLLLGHRVASDFGGVQKAGYMPDSFGHVAQMPQILSLAGIGSFIYTRGNGDEVDRLGWEFTWRAPDGSQVLAVNQVRGYCGAGGLGMHEVWHAHTPREVDLERAVTQVAEIFEAHRERARTDVVLVNNGCDHFPPPRDLALVLGALRGAFPDTEFRTGGFEDYLREARVGAATLETFEGELLGGRLHHILSGVWSTRMYLKQANERAQSLLADVVEPLAARARFQLGTDYPGGLIDACWKELLENHPHDSICGCSTDEVHREMEARFESVIRSGEQLVRRGLKDLVPTFGPQPGDDPRTVLCVANPLPFDRTEIVRRLVILQPPAIDPERLALTDEEGRPVPCRIEKVRRVERFWGIDYRVELDGRSQEARFGVYEDRFGDRILRPESEKDTADTFLSVEFVADLPALGHVRYRLEASEEPASPERTAAGPAPVRAESDTLDNGLCSVRLHPNGTIDVEDHRSGRRFTGLNLLEDSEDVGDEYDFSRAARPETVDAGPVLGNVACVRKGGWSAVLAASFELRLPARATADRQGRASERASCPVEVRVELRAGDPLVRIETRFDNRAEDHRLRARFPTGLTSGDIWSDGHFLVNRRSASARPGGDGWVQPPPATIPQQEYSLVQDPGGGIAILNRGLPEVEGRQEAGSQSLYLTLLRSVGWLSRDDFDSRLRTNAGPTLYTPEAQCPGTHTFRYAVLPFSGHFLDAGVPRASRRYRVEPASVQGVLAGSVPGGRSLVRQEMGAATITAIKRHVERDSLVVRLYNPGSNETIERLAFDPPPGRAWEIDLLEQRVMELPVEGDGITVRLAPHRIFTLEIEPAIA